MPPPGIFGCSTQPGTAAELIEILGKHSHPTKETTSSLVAAMLSAFSAMLPFLTAPLAVQAFN
eukprot:7117675-Karenia_brevis.AAC.1